ncbi:DUF1428 domain-containing protein [Aureimonas jatrophae]|nr:uncharacterized protein YbaA (DUF1428 family) [Aureimonas jatrophae]
MSTTREPSAMGYIDGFVVAVPRSNRDAYRQHAELALAIFLEHGALRGVEGWGDDVPVGQRTDFRRAVQAEENEVVLFSWIEWPSKSVRDAAMPTIFADPRLKDEAMPFDGARMIVGGFEPIVDAKR